MTDPVSGQPLPHSLQETYRNEFAKGVKLFEESLNAYETTSNDEAAKKAKFKDVMDKALTIMNQSARGFLNQSGQMEEAKLEKDYQSFIASDNPAAQKQLHEDIRHIKGFV